MSDIIDIVPIIKLRREESCEHHRYEVSEIAASISCIDCGADVDPWFVLRRLAREGDSLDDAMNKIRAHYDAEVTRYNAHIRRLHAEVADLTEAKNRLWNFQVNGQPLGTLRRRRRRAKP